ncbi:unnamed protein product [Amoebophrya sp. A25]|nr:unnamed protein product [Amoebophrya sp. A25]|eukprot:GSA25T00021131001.1
MKIEAHHLLPLLFAGHAFSSVTLILLNKNIALVFPYAFTTVFLQNFGTLFGAAFLHIIRVHPLRFPPKRFLLRLLINAVWLVGVLWASIVALQKVSVPLYVLARNTVPFQTALLDWAILGSELNARTLWGLALTFIGTTIYTTADMEVDSTGISYAMLNTVLVASICVYESATMKMVKAELSPIQMNFSRVLFTTPFLVLPLYFEWFRGEEGATTLPFDEIIRILRNEPVVTFQIAVSAILAFSIGNFLLSLQARVSATTIQLANMGYKFATTLLSRFTHPSEVKLVGWLGYAICTAGLVQYAVRPSSKKTSSGGATPSKKGTGTAEFTTTGGGRESHTTTSSSERKTRNRSSSSPDKSKARNGTRRTSPRERVVRRERSRKRSRQKE